jgi:hypothetical protein
MGAALTYARRYALFTLVGIAGKDDLDAPDLALSAGPREGQNSPPADQSGSGSPKLPAAASRPSKSSGARPRAERHKLPSLAPDSSARLRDQLMAELEQFSEAHSLTAWAYRALPLKNQLSTSDAQAVEATFDAKLRGLEAGAGTEASEQTPPKIHPEPIRLQASAETVVVLEKPVRERDRHPSQIRNHPAVSDLRPHAVGRPSH